MEFEVKLEGFGSKEFGWVVSDEEFKKACEEKLNTPLPILDHSGKKVGSCRIIKKEDGYFYKAKTIKKFDGELLLGINGLGSFANKPNANDNIVDFVPLSVTLTIKHEEE